MDTLDEITEQLDRAFGEEAREVREAAEYEAAREGLAREIYVGLLSQVGRRFATLPSQRMLEHLRDFAFRAAAVWLDDPGEYAEYALAEEETDDQRKEVNQ